MLDIEELCRLERLLYNSTSSNNNNNHSKPQSYLSTFLNQITSLRHTETTGQSLLVLFQQEISLTNSQPGTDKVSGSTELW